MNDECIMKMCIENQELERRLNTGRCESMKRLKPREKNSDRRGNLINKLPKQWTEQVILY